MSGYRGQSPADLSHDVIMLYAEAKLCSSFMDWSAVQAALGFNNGKSKPTAVFRRFRKCEGNAPAAIHSKEAEGS